MRFLISTLLLSILLLVGCATSRPDCDPAIAAATSNKTSSDQKQGHLSTPVTVVRDGNPNVEANRLGVDIQGAANGAANPVTIGPLVEANTAGIALLKTQTPEEKALAVRVARIQRGLSDAATDRSLAAPADRAGIDARVALLEGQESLAMARLAEIFSGKLDTAKAMSPDLRALASVSYKIFAPNMVMSGKPGSDATWAAAAGAFSKWIEEQKTADAAKEGGNGE